MGLKRIKDMRARLEGVTGVILAGGKSTRYGTNKAFAEVHGTKLIERVVQTMERLFERLLLVTNTPHEYAYLKLPMEEDIIKGLGPIGGIHTGLETISDEAGFFVACDMPYLNENLLRHMVTLKGDSSCPLHQAMPSCHKRVDRLAPLSTHEVFSEDQGEIRR
jgi:molybdopterin-guanine dinucleotide biosynthesis protein A